MLKIKDSNGPRFLRLITEQFLQSYSHFNKPDEASSAFDPYIFLWDHLTNLWIYIVVDAGLSPLKRAQWREMFHHWTTQLNCPREDTYFCLEVVDSGAPGPMIVNGSGSGYYHQGHTGGGSSSSAALLPSTSSSHSDYHSGYSGEGGSSSSSFEQYLSSNNNRSSGSSSGSQRRSSYYSSSSSSSSHYHQLASHHYGNYGSYGSHHYGSSNHHHLQGHQPSTSSGGSSSRSYRRRRILERAYDATFLSWEDRHLKRILREDGPFLDHQSLSGSCSDKHVYSYGEYYDLNGFPIWPGKNHQKMAI